MGESQGTNILFTDTALKSFQSNFFFYFKTPLADSLSISPTLSGINFEYVFCTCTHKRNGNLLAFFLPLNHYKYLTEYGKSVLKKTQKIRLM